ncbi:DUF4383 domain-containing protein [Micromonospora sp. SL4-19]|uniref:DUF4383 domain-containing protein n=1 Tax=Micromonospora sp. SL4-19 TaxID=3399129 RepID=UPI003A4DC0C8
MTNAMAHSRGRRNPAEGRALVSRTAATFGVLFLVAGVLGFIPGVTTNFHDLYFAGHDSTAKLFGAFQVSVLHNIVHLLFGVAGLAMSATSSGARSYLVGGGAIYLVLWLYGLAVVHRTTANFIPVNAADNWLHLGLGIGMIVLGLLTTRAMHRR